MPRRVAAAPIQFRNRAEWRAWLEEHHADANEAVLYVSKKGMQSGIHYEEAVEEALCFGWIDSKGRAYDAKRFTLRFSPRKPDGIWSLSNRERVNRLTRAGRMKPAGLAQVRIARASGAWERALHSGEKPRMPSDLRRALRAAPTAWARFRAMTDSYQGTYIQWVLDAKREDTRTKRIRLVVERSAKNLRPGEPES